MEFTNKYCDDCQGDTTQELNPITGVTTCVVCGKETEGVEKGSWNGNSRTNFYPIEE